MGMVILCIRSTSIWAHLCFLLANKNTYLHGCRGFPAWRKCSNSDRKQWRFLSMHHGHFATTLKTLSSYTLRRIFPPLQMNAPPSSSPTPARAEISQLLEATVDWESKGYYLEEANVTKIYSRRARNTHDPWRQPWRKYSKNSSSILSLLDLTQCLFICICKLISLLLPNKFERSILQYHYCLKQ